MKVVFQYFINYSILIFLISMSVYSIGRKSTHSSTPMTNNQSIYKNMLDNEFIKILLVTGPAGTGKTKLVCDYAINQFLKNQKKIIITRPIITVENENLGFIPGTINDKMDPWTRPIFDIFQEYLSKDEIKNYIAYGYIETSPLGFMRGRTFHNSIIIADEMQNSTPKQMLMLLTRIGHNSKLIITGDNDQSDLGMKNGLNDLSYKLETFSKHYNLESKGIGIVTMDENDIVRDEIVKVVLDIYSGGWKNILFTDPQSPYL